MERFTIHTGLVAPLDRENVDTDSIIPKQFLKSIKRTGFGPHLFDAWRYFDVGEPGMDLATRRPNPDFVLNKPQFQGATIMLARKNFGCGSSREHAPWALQQAGYKALIAPSFADIFLNNSFKNGLLPVVLTEAQVDKLFHEVAAHPGYRLTIDLPAQIVVPAKAGTPLDPRRHGDDLDPRRHGDDAMHFDIEPSRKESLLNGWDEIGLTLRHEDEIKAYEERRKKAEPWIFS